MAQVLIRDLDEDVIKVLKERAEKHQRSLQGELKAILTQAARVSPADATRIAAKIRRKLAGRHQTDSAKLLAEDRGR